MTALQVYSPKELMDTANQLAKATIISSDLRAKPADVFLILMTGQDLGLAPTQALRGIHIIKGKAVISADLMIALCLRQKDVCEYFSVVKTTDQVAVYETKRVGVKQPVTMEFTIKQAENAQLTTKQGDTWKNYPAAMLRARCAAALARTVYPDLVMGVYETGEGAEIAAGFPQNGDHPIEAEVVEDTSKISEADAIDSTLAAIKNMQSLSDLQRLDDEIKAMSPHAKNIIRPLYASKRVELMRSRSQLEVDRAPTAITYDDGEVSA
jgi:hypothetical protein